MYNLKLIYRENQGQFGNSKKIDLNINFRIHPADVRKSIIKNRLNYYENFVNGNATIKEYLEKYEGFKVNNSNKNTFLKNTKFEDYAILTIKKPLLADGLNMYIHFTFPSRKNSLEEMLVLNPKKLNDFLENGAFGILLK